MIRVEKVHIQAMKQRAREQALAARLAAKKEREIARAAKAREREVIRVEKAHVRALKQRAREQDRVSKAGAAIAQKARLAMAALGVALAAGVKAFAALAFETVESQALVSESFGTMTADAKSWAANLSDSLGLNRYESERMSAILFTMTESMGLTSDAAFKLSTGAVELAADMASFYNLSHEEVLDKIKAGLTGEAEPLKRLGILVNENTIKQVAYNAGIAARGAALTETQKVEARWLAITQQTTKAQGDLARTMESPTNQLRRMRSELMEAFTVLSQAMLPALSLGVKILTKFARAGAAAVSWIAESRPTLAFIGTLVGVTLVFALKAAALALWAMVPPMSALTGGINLIIPAVALLAAGAAAAWIKWGGAIKDFLRKVWAKMLGKIGAGLRMLSKFVGIWRKDWARAMAKAGEGLQETSEKVVTLAKVTENSERKIQRLPTVLEKTEKATKKTVDEVQNLIDTWTGATLKSGEFLKAFNKLTPAQRKNDRIMSQVIERYKSMRKVLGPFNDDLEVMIEQELLAGDAAKALAKSFKEAAKEAMKLDKQQIAITKSSKSFFENITGGFKDMLRGITGGKGLAGMFKGIGSGITQGIGNIISGGLAQITGLALKGVVKLGKKIWGGIKGLFGRGKRKREQAAREEMARIAAVTKAAEEAAAKQRAYMDTIYSSSISAYDRAKSAGVSAYDKIFLASLESGLGQEEAIAKAEAAQLAASEKILAAEGEKFARMAAFEAALEAIRSGNASGAADAAALAAAETRTAWETAMEAVKVADKAAGSAMIDTANKVAAIQQRKASEAAAAQVAASRRAASAWSRQFGGGPMAAAGGQFGGFRQHGGPVSAGRSYVVGEAGPERFIPSQSGRIDPNGSSGSGMDAKDLARAVAEALEGMKVELDGRKLGRAVVRHQPLAVVELGGRR